MATGSTKIRRPIKDMPSSSWATVTVLAHTGRDAMSTPATIERAHLHSRGDVAGHYAARPRVCIAGPRWSIAGMSRPSSWDELCMARHQVRMPQPYGSYTRRPMTSCTQQEVHPARAARYTHVSVP